MTAGSGIIHQEMPLASERMLGLQLWLNLPAKDKMTTPAYGDIKQEQVSVIEEENAKIRIVAGSYKSQKGAFEGKYVKVNYLDIELSPNCDWSYSEAANDETLFTYLLDGTVAVNESLDDFENKGCAVLFTSTDSHSSTNDSVTLRSGAQGARFVLASAKPLKESIAWGGPIVMNTREELDQAFAELDNGTFIKK